MRKVGNLDSRGNKRVQTVNTDPSETVQSDAHLADIRTVMRQYGQEGIEMLDETALTFGDVSEFGDFHDVMIQVKEAEIQFLKLPAKVRLIYENDVTVWLDTAHDKDKRDALVEAGFLKTPKEATKKKPPETAVKDESRVSEEVASATTAE